MTDRGPAPSSMEAVAPDGVPRQLVPDNLAERSGITAVMHDGTELAYNSLSRVAEPSELRDLWVHSGAVHDADLAILSRASRLASLALPGFGKGKPADITDRGLEAISRLRDIRILTIASDRITDAGVARLAPLANLMWLNLEARYVTDVGIANLRQMPKLEFFALHAPLVTDDALANFGRLDELIGLDVRGTSVTGTCFKALEDRSHHLRGLTGNFTDEGLNALSKLPPQVFRLDIVGPGMTDAGLGHLSKIRSLRLVGLHGTRTTVAGVRELRKKCAMLRSIVRD